MAGEGPVDQELLTIRDWLRFAVSRFNAAGLHYGHGTVRALDEAAFIILTALNLGPDDLEPWLDARLTSEERSRLGALIGVRVSARTPASYLVKTAYIRGRRFICDERAIIPRSFIGELLCNRMDEDDDSFPPFPLPDPAERILDLCTGGGSLAILAAEAFPEAAIDAIDISPDALALAAENVALHGLEERINLIRSDLFAKVKGRRYDLILCNPPYVTDDNVAAFPPEYQAEPRLAHAGGADGLDLVKRILSQAAKHLEPEGQLVLEVGMAGEVLDDLYPDLLLVWIDTEVSEGEVFAISAEGLSEAGP
ncbi:MAG: 50S ribosomal protein L3 N(5)-glutamine methyltransferase [Hyphomicrobiaceae bacterium]